MSNEVDADFVLARQLQAQFDSELIELSSDDDADTDLKVAMALDAKFKLELADDEADEQNLNDSDVVETKPMVSKKMMRATLDSDFVFNESRLNPNTFFVVELHQYIDRQYNGDWEFITEKMTPKIDNIYQRLKARFFGTKLDGQGLVIKWRRTMGTEVHRHFVDNDGCYTVWLNEPFLRLRPRIELISVLLHEMIHALLKFSGINEPNDGHGANFRHIMTFYNRNYFTNIKTTHTSMATDDSELKRQFWRCRGVCGNYTPFYGVVRSESEPGVQCEWWVGHQRKCGGTFFRIFEAVNKVDGIPRTQFVVSCHYMEPKAIAKLQPIRRPRETVDLTNDSPKIQAHNVDSHLETVNVDDQTVGGDVTFGKAFVQNLQRSVFLDPHHIKCPICDDDIKVKLFCGHLDGCRGFIREIPFTMKRGLANPGPSNLKRFKTNNSKRF